MQARLTAEQFDWFKIAEEVENFYNGLFENE